MIEIYRKSRGSSLFLCSEISKIGKSVKRETTLYDRSRKSEKEDEKEDNEGRTKEESSKNKFGSQDGQEVPNSRERIVKMAKLV